jgi:hypothetical protein
MARNYILLFMLLCSILTSHSQSLTAKIIDNDTKETIPYATIRVNDTSDLISNGEGFFTLTGTAASDETALTVSYLGYNTAILTVAILKNQNLTIRLTPGVFELDNVNVSNIKPDPNKIMAEVKKNLQKHYKPTDTPSKNTIFFREANTLRPSKMEIEITKSTGFSKQGLTSANSQIKAFTSKLIKSPPQEFTDMLSNYYSSSVVRDGKTVSARKLEVVKATKLKDENKSTSIDDVEKVATNILLQHIDTTKYYRIKSGWFGSNDTISLRKDFQQKKKKKSKKSEVVSAKSNLSSFMADCNPSTNKDLDFISDHEIYTYTYEGAVYSADNEFIYVLNFKPRKSRAKYTGKLYVSENDFAVIRVDYDFAPGKKGDSFNMKLLLGIKFAESVSRGTLIYAKRTEGTGYYLKYASTEDGQYIYVNRPIKFIELTKQEKDVVALEVKIEGTSLEKHEFLSMSRTLIDDAAYKKVSEDDFSYIRINRYDPAIWKNYSSIEPLEEMKQYQITD